MTMCRSRIYCDTRQHDGKHDRKMKWWADHGVETEVRKLDFGDYMADGSNVSVDTKRGIAEIAQNISRDHARFRRECDRAAEAGCRLVILVENREGIRDTAGVRSWRNPHCYRQCRVRAAVGCDPRAGGRCAWHKTMKPIQGGRLAKAMETMEARHGVLFMFCRPEESAQTICELLGVSYE